jgi:hypothetical protein
MSTATLRSNAYWYARGQLDAGSDVMPTAFAIAYVDAYARFGRIPAMTESFNEFAVSSIITEKSVVC